MARLQKLAERVYPESQCGIRAERSTVDMIVSLRQLQEKCREQQMPLYVAFIDLTKVFDFQQRRPLQYPAKGWLIEPPPPPHSNMQGTVQFNGSTSGPFNVCSGVKRGCVLAPILFGIFFALPLKRAFGTSREGIYLRTRSHGRLFNLVRLRAMTKVHEPLIRDMLFACDAAVATHTQLYLKTR